MRRLVIPILVGLNLLVFVLMVLAGVSPLEPESEQLIDWGANFGALTLNGQWWRLLASTFVHIDLLHLAFNMQCLWLLGGMAERLLGRPASLALYLLSGLGGSINRGLAYMMAGQYENALADFDRALEREHEPDQGSTFLFRAMARAELGQREAAAGDVERALEVGVHPDLRPQAERMLSELNK